MRLVCRQLESEARSFKCPPKVLNLRDLYSTADLCWSIHTDISAKLTTIEFVGSQFGFQVRDALRREYFRTPGSIGFRSLERGKQSVRDAFANLQCVRTWDVPNSEEARSQVASYWKNMFERPELEVVFM